jgi:serine/threonine protein kinase
MVFILQDDNDMLRRSPGTPVFTASECILGWCFHFMLVKCIWVMMSTKRRFSHFVFVNVFLGVTYSGKAADTWAVGVTLYCMILGEYPFLGDTWAIRCRPKTKNDVG